MGSRRGQDGRRPGRGQALSGSFAQRPQGQPDSTEQIFVPLSQEQILGADADIVLVSAFYNGTPLSMVSAIVACGIVAFTLSFRIMKPNRAYP